MPQEEVDAEMLLQSVQKSSVPKTKPTLKLLV